MLYLGARDTYGVEREDKTGKGFAEFTFYPRRKADTPFILELKKDENVEAATKQIKEKEYFQKFMKEFDNIQAFVICYDSKIKEHSCKIEIINLNIR
ncbi:PD-(D/E)XK nuclease domain-containing protein [Clostridium gasigenes]|uniref:PD-(D/E)XK nuclease domain-containing protein n=1 Tax=Clostridium gasigenes TaxID=94869 RepID=UPI00209AA89E|nr:PD-(D/E)XK nuclease domain-containing protein [Clostridium gasigenes]